MAAENWPEMKVLASKCRNCTQCWKPYQTEPMLGIINPSAHTLVIGQNPAVMRYEKEKEEYEIFSGYSARLYLDWYRKWFLKSTAYQRLGDLYFGEGWLENGEFSYTNAVRCRTENNARPPDYAIENCREFTKSLVEAGKYRCVILVGAVAKLQMSETMSYGIFYRWRGLHVLAVKHYAARMPLAESEFYGSRVEEMLQAVRIKSSTDLPTSSSMRP